MANRMARGTIVKLAGMIALGVPAGASEPTFRVRSDIAAPLNADTGWAGPEGEIATVDADRPFRLRFESVGGPGDGPLVLEVRRNDGDWQRLEAHDFPYPNRDFDPELEAGSTPWQVLAGSSKQLVARMEQTDPVLSVDGGESGLLAVLPLPWPTSHDGAIAAHLRLAEGSDSIALLWGVVDATNYHAVRIHADGRVEVSSVVEGQTTDIAQATAKIAPANWHEIEIEIEQGDLTVVVDERDVLAARVVQTRGQAGIALDKDTRAEISDFSVEGLPRTPGVSIVSSPAYAHGTATSDLLGGTLRPFAPGIGISLWDEAPTSSDLGTHREYEWPLVIRRLGDGPSVNETGDRFAFRMVRTADRAVVGPEAVVELAVPAGHLGGTFVETPGRIGPFQATNGDLYFIMEPAETDNKFMMMKSADGGRSWTEVDGTRRPATGDLEAVDARLVGDRIVILHQVTNSVRLHTFRTSDHSSGPDSWEIRDELAAKARAVAQMATLAPRSDGSMVAVFLAERLQYVVRSPAGVWSAPAPLDAPEEVINAGPQAATGNDDTIHIAYFTDDGRIWYRRMLADGVLTERRLVAEGAGSGRSVYGAVLPLAYDSRNNTVTIAYRLADGSLWERTASHRGELAPAERITVGPVVTNAVDSQQAGADLVSTAAGAVALHIHGTTGGISSSRKNGQLWSDPVSRIRDIRGVWVRGSIVTRTDGQRVYGFVYDAGSEGGTGMNRYAEMPLNE